VCGISQLLFNESLIAAMQLEKRGKQKSKKKKHSARHLGRKKSTRLPTEELSFQRKPWRGAGWADKEGGMRRVLLFDYTLQRKRALHSAGVIRQWWCW
jgi:hypothetical protein